MDNAALLFDLLQLDTLEAGTGYSLLFSSFYAGLGGGPITYTSPEFTILPTDVFLVNEASLGSEIELLVSQNVPTLHLGLATTDFTRAVADHLENTQLHFRDGAEQHTIVFSEGLHSVSSLNSEMLQYFLGRGLPSDPPLFAFASAGDRVEVTIQYDGYQILFQNQTKNIGSLLGFRDDLPFGESFTFEPTTFSGTFVRKSFATYSQTTVDPSPLPLQLSLVDSVLASDEMTLRVRLLDNFGTTDISDRLEGTASVVVDQGIASFSDLRGDSLSGRSFQMLTYLEDFELCSKAASAFNFSNVSISSDCLPAGGDVLNTARGSIAGFSVEAFLPFTLIFYPDKLAITAGASGITELLVGEQITPTVELNVLDSVTDSVVTSIAAEDGVYAEARLLHAEGGDVTELFLAGGTRQLVEGGYAAFGSLKVRGVVGSEFRLQFRLAQGFGGACASGAAEGCGGFCCVESSSFRVIPHSLRVSTAAPLFSVREGAPLAVSVSMVDSSGSLLAIQDRSLAVQLDLKQRLIGKSQFVSGAGRLSVEAGAACSCAVFEGLQILRVLGSEFTFEASHPTGTRTAVGVSPEFAVVPYSISSSTMPDIVCNVAIVGPRISLLSITEQLLPPPSAADGFVLNVSLVSDGGAFDAGDSIVVVDNQYTVTNLQVNSDIFGCLGAVRVRFVLLRDGELLFNQTSNEFLVTPSSFRFSFPWDHRNLLEARALPPLQVEARDRNDTLLDLLSGFSSVHATLQQLDDRTAPCPTAANGPQTWTDVPLALQGTTSVTVAGGQALFSDLQVGGAAGVCFRLDLALKYRGQTIFSVQTNSFTVWPSQFFIQTDCEDSDIQVGRCNPRVVEGDVIQDVVLNAADSDSNTLDMIEARDGVSVIATLEQCSISCANSLDSSCRIDQSDPATVHIAADNVAASMMSTAQTQVSDPGSEAGDAGPMVTRAAAFVVREIAQNTSLPRALNAITATLVASVSIEGASGAAITLRGLVGTRTADSLQFDLFALPGGANQSNLTALFASVSWTQATGTLLLTLAPDRTIAAGEVLAFGFVVENDDVAQSAPEITVEAEGGPSIQAQAMASAAGDAAALFLKGRSFIQRVIGQSSPFPGAVNTIRVTLAATIAISAGEMLTIEGLVGSQTADTAAFVGFSFSSTCGLEPLSWTRSPGILVLQLSQDLGIEEACTAEFQLLNPAWGQGSPDVKVSLPDADLPIPPESMVVSSELLPWLGSDPGDAAPLRVYDAAITFARMAQTSPYPSMHNTLTLTIAANVALEGNVTINVSNLAGAGVTCPTSVGVSTEPLVPPQAGTFDVACCAAPSECTNVTYGGSLPSQSRFCSDPAGTCVARTAVMDGAAVININLEGTVSPGVPIVLSWDVLNPSLAQDSPAIVVQVSGLPNSVAVESDGGAQPAVAAADSNAAKPLHVIDAGFAVRRIGQSSPWPGGLNNISVTLAVTTDLEHPGSITVSGLPVSNLVSAAPPSTLSYSAGSSAGTDLVFASQSTVLAGEEFVIRLLLQNPSVAQSSPRVFVRGQGSCASGCSLGPQEMDRDSTTMLPLPSSEAGDSMPLRVRSAGFVVLQLGQSHPYPSASNTITATLTSNLQVPAGSAVRLLNLSGVHVVDVSDLNFTEVLGNVFDEGSIGWNQTTGTLTLELDQVLEAGATYVFSIDFTNPSVGQTAPDVQVDCIAAGGGTLIEAASVVGDTGVPPGVLGAAAGDALPLQVQPPGFALRQISQSTTFPSALNTLSIEFSTNVEIASDITITGLRGSATASTDALPITDAESTGAGSIFSGLCPMPSPCGAWNATTGTLTLVHSAGSSLSAGVRYSLQFQVTNPASKTLLRQTFVEGWAAQVCSESGRLINSPFTEQLMQGVATFSGMRIRNDVGIYHFRLSVVNASDTQSVFARVLSDPFTVFPPDLRLRSGQAADAYVVSRDWWSGAGAAFELGIYSASSRLFSTAVPLDGIEVQAQLLRQGTSLPPSRLGGATGVLVDGGVAAFTDLRFVETAGRGYALRFVVAGSPSIDFVQTDAFSVVPSDLEVDNVASSIQGGMTLGRVQVKAVDGRGNLLSSIQASDEFYVFSKLIAGGVDLTTEKLHGTTSQLLVSGATAFTDLSVVGAFGSDFTLLFEFSAAGLSTASVTARTNSFTVVPIDAVLDFDATGLKIVDSVLPAFTITMRDSTGGDALQSGGSQFVFHASLFHHGRAVDRCLSGTNASSPVNGTVRFDDFVISQSAGTNFSMSFTLFMLDGEQEFPTGVSVRSEAFTVIPFRIQAKPAPAAQDAGVQISVDQRGRITGLSPQIDISDSAALPAMIIEAVDTQGRLLNCSFSADFPVVASVFLADVDVTGERLTGGDGVELQNSVAAFTDLAITSRDNLLLRLYLANVPCLFGANCYDISLSIIPFAAQGPHVANASQPAALQSFFADRVATPQLSLVANNASVAASVGRTLELDDQRVEAAFAQPPSAVEYSVSCPDADAPACPTSPSAWLPAPEAAGQASFAFAARPLDLADSQLPLGLQVIRTQEPSLLAGTAAQSAAFPARVAFAVRSPGSLAADETFSLDPAPPAPQAAAVGRLEVAAVHARYKAQDFEVNSQTWPDASGAGRDALVLEGFAVRAQGAPGLAAVSGGSEVVLRFPADALPDDATVCSVARRDSADALSGTAETPAALGGGEGWVHGLYVGASWLAGGGGEWTVQCGQNGGLQLRLQSNASADFDWNGTSSAAAPQPATRTRLSINAGRSAAWEVAEVAVWARALAREELYEVMAYYKALINGSAPAEPAALTTEGEALAGFCATRLVLPCVAPSGAAVCTAGSTSLSGVRDAYDGSLRAGGGSSLLQRAYSPGDALVRVASVAALGFSGDGRLRTGVPIEVGGGGNRLWAVGYNLAANSVEVRPDALSTAVLADGEQTVELAQSCAGGPSEVAEVAVQPAAGSETMVFQISDDASAGDPAVLACPNSYGTQQPDGSCRLFVALNATRRLTLYAVEAGLSSLRTTLTFTVDACRRQAVSPCARNFLCANNRDAFASEGTFCIPRSPFSPVCTVSWSEMLPYECAFSLQSPSAAYTLLIVNGTLRVERATDGAALWSTPPPANASVLQSDPAVLRLYGEELRLQTQAAHVHLWPAVFHHGLTAVDKFELDDGGTLSASQGSTLRWRSIGGDRSGQGYGCHLGACCYSDRVAVAGIRASLSSAAASPGAFDCNTSLVSANGQYALSLGLDGALQVRVTASGDVVWATAAASSVDPAGYELRVNNESGAVSVVAVGSEDQVWPLIANHPVEGAAALVVGNDGALRAYDAEGQAVWESIAGDANGNGHGCGRGVCCWNDRLAVGGGAQELRSGGDVAFSEFECQGTLRSSTGESWLNVGAGGVLGVYDAGGALLWSTNASVAITEGLRFSLSPDGSFFLADAANNSFAAAFWPTAVTANIADITPVTAIVVDADGRVRGYASGGIAEWETDNGSVDGALVVL